jgi:hypothetical protein
MLLINVGMRKTLLGSVYDINLRINTQLLLDIRIWSENGVCFIFLEKMLHNFINFLKNNISIGQYFPARLSRDLILLIPVFWNHRTTLRFPIFLSKLKKEFYKFQEKYGSKVMILAWSLKLEVVKVLTTYEYKKKVQ